MDLYSSFSQQTTFPDPNYAGPITFTFTGISKVDGSAWTASAIAQKL